jgi:hypothetical protein
MQRQALSVPEPPTPLVSLGEGDPLGAAPTYFPWDGGGLLSEVEAFESVAVGLPPRVVDPTLLKAMKQVGVGAGTWGGRGGVLRGQQLAAWREG